MSEQLDTPPEDTPNYQAMYEAANAEKEKISGQYKSLQKKHSATAKVSKTDVSDKDDAMTQLQAKYDALEEKSNASAKKTLLTQIKNIDSAMAKEHENSDVSILEIVLATATGMKSGFPSHEKNSVGKPKNPLDVGTYDPSTGQWK